MYSDQYNTNNPEVIGFNQEEAELFFVDQPKPESVVPTVPGVTKEEVTNIINASQQQTQSEINYLRQQLDRKTTTEETKATLPSEMRVMIDADKGAYIPAEAVQPLIESAVQSRIDDYHKRVIEPVVPTVRQLDLDNKVDAAANIIKKLAPDLVTDDNKTVIGRTSLELYESPFNTGYDDKTKTEYVVNELRTRYGGAQAPPAKTQPTVQLPYSTGSGSGSHNQVGSMHGLNQPTGGYPYPPGSTIKIKSARPIDFDSMAKYSEHVAKIDHLYELNQRHGLGWKFEQID